MRFTGVLALSAVLALAAVAGGADTDRLPAYTVAVTLDTDKHHATIKQTITWTNPANRPTNELVLNFYPQYRIPEGDHLLLAKTLELLRLNPAYGIDRHGRHGSVSAVRLRSVNGRPTDPTPVRFHFRHDNPTAVVVELPEIVAGGQSVCVEVEAEVRLPNKQGRWGYWQGVHSLANAVPVAAFYDDQGWHAMPFIPWHQPFWNEAGRYAVTIRVPAAQKVACSAAIGSEAVAADGWKELVCVPFVGRDFAILASAEYEEHTLPLALADGKQLTLKCLAFPRHAHYAKEILRIAADAIPVYADWFGPFPYPQLTFAESFFGWNGNECAGLVMIDERVFQAPHLGRGYVEYLVSHETCHQWWYNVVGTNGYAETFMDEGAATFFTHRMLDRKKGRNSPFLTWPKEVDFLPNIYREDYRYASMVGAIRRGEMPAAAGELPGFNHLVGLFSGAYDRGSKVYGMVEARLGTAGFDEFIRTLVERYSWRVLSAAAFRAELEEHTGQDWGEFFERWVYGKGLTDWEVESVTTGAGGPRVGKRVSVVVRQSAEYDEPTTLGVRLAGGDGFPIRIPLGTGRAGATLDEFDGTLTPLPGNRVRVDLTLPGEPEQIAIDPDGVLLDRNPGNNLWKNPPRVYVTPVYSMLNETDLTNDLHRWNIGGGPWVGGALYPDPWYTRSTMAGVRVGTYRTQTFNGGLYAAYRTDYRDVVVGADGLWDHWPLKRAQLGFNVEQRVAGPVGSANGRETALRANGFARYVHQYSSSLYLPPMAYTEGFTGYQDNFLPLARTPSPGAQRPDWTWTTGVHTRWNLYTPYWDPECGVWFDAMYAAGVAKLGPQVGVHQVRGELAAVKKLPWNLGPLTDTRVAGRFVGFAATPDRGQFFALGGGTLFRGFDLAERQGSALWVASSELRLPIVRDVEWDVADHLAGARNVWLAVFYDVGAVYANGRSVGGIAHAVGAGLRVDVAIFSFIERATLRFDVGKTLNAATPFQFWFGVQHAF